MNTCTKKDSRGIIDYLSMREVHDLVFTTLSPDSHGGAVELLDLGTSGSQQLDPLLALAFRGDKVPGVVMH